MKSFIVFIVVVICASSASAATFYCLSSSGSGTSPDNKCLAVEVTLGAKTYTLNLNDNLRCLGPDVDLQTLNDVKLIWRGGYSNCEGDRRELCHGAVTLSYSSDSTSNNTMVCSGDMRDRDRI